MNLFVATENNNYIEKIKKSLSKHYKLTFMTTLDDFLKIFSDSDELESNKYILVLIDYKLYQKYDITSFFKKDEEMTFSPILLCDNVEDIDFTYVLDTRTSLMISMETMTSKELYMQIKLSIYNFYKIQQIHSYAFFDLLTKIGNRRTFMKNLELYFQYFKCDKTSFCLALIDLDHFKFVNDTFGHLKGDDILAITADIMQKNCRKTDILARIGGEEFAIIFPATTLKEAYDVLEKIRLCVENTQEMDESVKITLSAGLVSVREEYTEYKDLFFNADLLLYKAKDLGRNKICM